MNFIVALLIPAISALMVNVSPNIYDVEAIMYSPTRTGLGFASSTSRMQLKLSLRFAQLPL
jgi:hypothetical protein